MSCAASGRRGIGTNASGGRKVPTAQRLTQHQHAKDQVRHKLHTVGTPSKHAGRLTSMPAYSNLGSCYGNIGQYGYAIELHERSKHIAELLGNYDALGRAYCNIYIVADARAHPQALCFRLTIYHYPTKRRRTCRWPRGATEPQN